MAGGAGNDEAGGLGLLLGGLDGGVAVDASGATDTATFGETDFGVDFGPALGGEVADTGVRGGFLTGFGDKDDVAVKKRT